MMRHHVFKGIATALLLSGSHAALAQVSAGPATPSAQSGGLSDIIVTATRRETNVQDTPLAISAISGESLRNSGIVDPRQLSSLAPSLTVDQGVSNGQTHVSIRGIASTDFGIGSNSPVAINIDDVYQPFQFGIASQVFDLNRIEVLRGPQGTLFGKNTTSGALNYYSQTPKFAKEGYVTLDGGGGDFGHFSGEGVYNTPLTENLAVRASVRVDRRNDYVDNLFDGSKLGHYTTFNGRLQFAWKPSSDTSINLKLFGMRNRGDGPIYISKYLSDPCQLPPGVFFNFPRSYLCPTGANPYPDSPDSRHTYSEVPTYENYHSYGATLKIDQALGDYALTSITGYQRGGNAIATNDDGSSGDSFHSFQGSKTWQISQELRVATPARLPVRAVFGVFGQYDKITTDQGSTSSLLDSPATGLFGNDYYTGSLGVQRGKSLAAFGSVTWDVTKRFSLVGGARYSWEKKKVDVGFLGLTTFAPGVGFRGIDLQADDIRYVDVTRRYPYDPNFDTALSYASSKAFKHVTWDATANYKTSDQSMIYARVASGFRSGGYQVGISDLTAYNPAKPYYDPETVMSYELGFKSEWFDRTLRVNGSAYWTDYDNLQVQIVNTSGKGSRLINAAKARIKGAEIEIELAPTTNLRFNGSLGYNDAKYRDFLSFIDLNRPRQGDATGNQLSYAPKWTANFGASYDLAVGEAHSVMLSTNWSYRSKVYFDPYEESIASDTGRLIGSARISYGTVEKGWRLSAYVNNLTNQDMKAFAFAFGGLQRPNSFLFAPAIYAPKRTWGLQASFNF